MLRRFTLLLHRWITSVCLWCVFMWNVQQGETAVDVARRKQHVGIVHLLMSTKQLVSWSLCFVCLIYYVGMLMRLDSLETRKKILYLKNYISHLSRILRIWIGLSKEPFVWKWVAVNSLWLFTSQLTLIEWGERRRGSPPGSPPAARSVCWA